MCIRDSDGTGPMLDRLAEQHPRLRVVHLAQNQGKAMALRMGALAARSEYLDVYKRQPHTRKNKEVVMFLPACAFGAVAVARNICCTGCRFRDALQTCTFDVFCYLHGEPCEPFPSRTTFRTRSAPIPAYRHDGCAVCSREYAKLRNNDPPFALIDSWIGRKPIKFDLLPAPPEAPQPRPTGVARTSPVSYTHLWASAPPRRSAAPPARRHPRCV